MVGPRFGQFKNIPESSVSDRQLVIAVTEKRTKEEIDSLVKQLASQDR
jgi:Glycine cleavage system protein P (pyridoxal-binding), N-terminal domain